jgi:hypothetical protein
MVRVAFLHGSNRALETLVMKPQRQGPCKLSQCVLPVVLPRAAGDRAGAILYVGPNLVHAAGAAHRDVQDEVAQPLAESHATAKKSRDLPAL